MIAAFLEPTGPMQTESPLAELLPTLEELFPGAVNDGALNRDAILGALGLLDATSSTYSFSWAGHDQAEREATQATTATFDPVTDLSVDWDATTHALIEGDNLQALKVMLRGLRNGVKLVYMDPPYNIGKTFTYQDDYSVPEAEYLRLTGQVDESGELTTSRTEIAGRKHGPWMTMMLSRLVLARQLLHPDGALFISIDDNEVHHLRILLDAVFGAENRLATLVWNRGHSQQQGVFKEYHEYVHVYAKNAHGFAPFGASADTDIIAGAMKRISRVNPESEFTFPAGVPCQAADGTEFTETWGDGETVRLVRGRFTVEEGKLAEEVTLAAGWTQADQMRRFFYGDGSDVLDTRGQKVKEFFFTATGKLKCRKERKVFTPETVLEYGTQAAASRELRNLFDGQDVFDRPKPLAMNKDFVRWLCTEDGDIAVDFFAGSGTLGHAVWAQNAEDGIRRRFVMVQAPEPVERGSTAERLGYVHIAQITRDRLIRAAAALAAEGDSEADQGFRYFRVAPTHLPAWAPPAQLQAPEEYVGAAVLFAETAPAIPADAAPNFAWEILLKGTNLGVSSKLQQRTVPGLTLAYETLAAEGAAGRTFIVLDASIPDSAIEALALGSDDALICFSASLTDTQAANQALACRLLLIERISGAVSL